MQLGAAPQPGAVQPPKTVSAPGAAVRVSSEPASKVLVQLELQGVPEPSPTMPAPLPRIWMLSSKSSGPASIGAASRDSASPGPASAVASAALASGRSGPASRLAARGDYIATEMPEDNPGSMKAGEYAAVLAYILKENGLPTGETALTGDEELLKRILIEAPEEVGRPQHGSLILHPSR